MSEIEIEPPLTDVLDMETKEMKEFLEERGYNFADPFIEKKYLEGTVKQYFYRRDNPIVDFDSFDPDEEEAYEDYMERWEDQQREQKAIEDAEKKYSKKQRETSRREKDAEEKRWSENLTDEEKAIWHDPLRIGGHGKYSRGTDFIEYYKEFMDSQVDSCSDYKEAMALFLISSLAKWNFVIYEQQSEGVIEQKMSFKPLNICFAMLGKSRIARKTTTIRPSKILIPRMVEEREITIKRGKQTETYKVNAILPKKFTPEALVSALNSRCWDRIMGKGSVGMKTHAIWINDEVSEFFVKLAKSDFMGGAAEILSDVWDGDTFSNQTAGRGLETVVNPYFTAMLASTFTLPKLFTMHMLEQGFLNRFLYVLDYKHSLVRNTNLPQQRKRWDNIQEWLKKLSNLQNTDQIRLFSPPDVNPKNPVHPLHIFNKNIMDKLEKADMGVLEPYYSQLGDMVQKLAALYRISRLSIEDFVCFEKRTMPKYYDPHYQTARWIEDEDFQRAIRFVRKRWIDFKVVVDIASQKSYVEPIRSLDAVASRIFKVIHTLYQEEREKLLATGDLKDKQKAKDVWIKRLKIQRKIASHIDAKQMQEALEWLQESDYIDMQPVPTPPSGKGRPTTQYQPLREFVFSSI